MEKKLNKQPEFFIVGAPKSGTTALFTYLNAHPNIFIPRKELNFFGKDLIYNHKTEQDFNRYHEFFKPAKPNQLCGDASVWYLVSETAAQEIKTYNANAKIIIMLRNPVDVIYSLHSQHLFTGNEDIEDFEEALSLETSRRKGEHIPKGASCPQQALCYRHVGNFTEQLKRYIETFGNRQVLVIDFEDFTKNTNKVYQEVLNFLEVKPFVTNFEQVNANKTVKSKAFRNLIKNRSKLMLGAAKVILPSRKLRYKVMDKLWKLNSKPLIRKPINSKLRKELEEYFKQ